MHDHPGGVDDPAQERPLDLAGLLPHGTRDPLGG